MSAGPRCVGTPISWLRLEQHHAGDLGVSKRAAITAHLTTCGACASCLARIVQDDALPLPALPVAPPAKVLAFRRVAPVLAALAVAAVILFVLVRDDEGVIAEAGGVYRDGDRWKALVTCPAGVRAAWDLVVFEHGEAAFPLEPQPDLACGNAVPLAGAFRTTGHEPMTVCVVWNDGALVDRGAMRGLTPESLPLASCKLLDPAR